MRAVYWPLCGVAISLALVSCRSGRDETPSQRAPERSLSSPAATPGVPASGFDVCSIVTEQDAEALFSGKAVQGGEVGPGMAGRTGSCIWEQQSRPGLPTQILQVDVYPDESFYSDAAFKQTAPLDVGERGFIGGMAEGALTLEFVVRGKTVIMTYTASKASGVAVTGKTAGLKEIARKIAGKLR